MDPDRAVDVRFTEAGGFGSGYLLSDRLVLTARHVAKAPAPGAPCVVRGGKDFAVERPGTLAWVSPHHDAALVDIAPNHAFSGLAARSPVFGDCPIGDETREAPPKYRCAAIGFPRASRIDEVREDWRLEGFARPPLRAPIITIEIEGRTPPAELWRGVSGAALFNRDLLIGIVESVPEGFGGGVLRATPAAILLNDADFLARVAPPGARPDTLIREARAHDFHQDFRKALAPLYCFIDRQSQVGQVESALTAAAPRGAARPRGFLIEGTEDDAHRRFIERIGQHPPLSSLWGDVESKVAITPLGWPRDPVLRDPAAAFETLKRGCAEALNLRPGAEASAQAFRAALPVAGRTLAVCWTVNMATAGRGHGALLDLWLGFCAEVSRGGAPLVWFACLVQDLPPERRGGRWPFGGGDGRPDPQIRRTIDRRVSDRSLSRLDGLGPVILAEDLGPWLDLVASRRRELGPADLAALKHMIETRVDGRHSVKMGPLVRAIDESLERI
jgi:hypothetical protein